jgi:PadR family transcriptional regulator, regulatory protein AphA
MTDEIELTPTSYIVLGLLSRHGEASPYDLKQMASASVGHFWTLPHSQLYAEPARLARAGYLTEEQEPRGRRRKRYSLAGPGRQALDDWLGTLTPEPYVLRDLALLKLFFGADVGELSEGQLETHRRKLDEYKALGELDPGTGPRGPWLALDLGLRHERVTVRFWSEHARASKGEPRSRPPRSPRRRGSKKPSAG